MDLFLPQLKLLIKALSLLLQISLCRSQVHQLLLVIFRELSVSHLLITCELLHFSFLLTQVVELCLFLICLCLNPVRLLLVELYLCRVSLILRSYEELRVANFAALAHLESPLQLFRCHVVRLLSIDSFSLTCEHSHLIHTLLACSMSAELTVVYIRFAHLCVTDYAECLLASIIHHCTL